MLYLPGSLSLLRPIQIQLDELEVGVRTDTAQRRLLSGSIAVPCSKVIEEINLTEPL